MTGTDLPTVVRNPKIKVKIKTAPQQTLATLGFTTARKPLTNPTSPVKAGHLARAEVHERTGHLDGSCRSLYDENMINEELAKAHQWASDLLETDEDRQMILEGLLEMIVDVTEGKPVDIAHYNRRYIHQ